MRWLVVPLLVSCSSQPSRGPARHESGPAGLVQCPNPAAKFRMFSVPSFAVAKHTVAGWSGTNIVLAKAGTEDGTSVRLGMTPQFWGSIYRDHTQSWHPIPEPQRLPRAEYVLRVVGGKLVLLWWGARSSWSGEIFDPATNAWQPIRARDAPPADAFRRGPYREASLDREWVFFPIGERGTDYRAGRLLDVETARWRRINPHGAPLATGRAQLVKLAGNHLLLQSPGVLAIYDPATDTWRTRRRRLENEAYRIAAVSPDGTTFALVTWSEPNPRKRKMRAVIFDSTTLATRNPDAATATVSGETPHYQQTAYDGRFVAHIGNGRLIRYDLTRNRWTDAALPFDTSVVGGGSLWAVCGGRMLFRGVGNWLLQTSTGTWTPMAWPSEVPPHATNELVLRDRLIRLGAYHSATVDYDGQLVEPDEDTRAFVVPIR